MVKASLGLTFQMLVSHHTGAGNRTQLLWRSALSWLSPHFSPPPHIHTWATRMGVGLAEQPNNIPRPWFRFLVTKGKLPNKYTELSWTLHFTF